MLHSGVFYGLFPDTFHCEFLPSFFTDAFVYCAKRALSKQSPKLIWIIHLISFLLTNKPFKLYDLFIIFLVKLLHEFFSYFVNVNLLVCLVYDFIFKLAFNTCWHRWWFFSRWILHAVLFNLDDVTLIFISSVLILGTSWRLFFTAWNNYFAFSLLLPATSLTHIILNKNLKTKF